MSWAVDGTTLRTVHKADTYNATTKTYQYPQTPAKIQFSLWPAGNPSNPEGTRDWAGGEISWNSSYMTNGYYWAQISDVNVECYNAPTGTNTTGSASYVYNGVTGLENTVALTNQNTTLASLYATGDDPKNNPYASVASGSSSATATGSAASSSSTASDSPTVPGGVGAGNRGSGSGSGTDSNTAAATVTTFVQGLLPSKATSAAGAGVRGSAVKVWGSVVAVVVGVCALVVL